MKIVTCFSSIILKDKHFENKSVRQKRKNIENI